MPEKRYFPLFAILLVIAIVACAFIVFSLVNIIFNVSTTDKEKDIRNWVSLTIESGIGIFIAMMVLYYDKLQQKKSVEQQKIMEQLLRDTKVQQDKISELIENTNKIIIEQKKINEQRRHSAINILLRLIKAIRITLLDINELVMWLNTHPQPESVTRKEIEDRESQKAEYLRNLEYWISLSTGVIELDLLTKIQKICAYARENGYEQTETKQWKPKMNIDTTVKIIEELVGRLHDLSSTSIL